MKQNKQDAKKQIIDSTIQLIRDHGDISKVTIRDICERSNVGVGLVNYHFQSKDNLIRVCVQKIIGNIINGFDDLQKSINLKPIDKLKLLLRINLKFLIENPGISKVSIISDLINGDSNDNSIQTRNAYLGLLKEIYGNSKTEDELKVILHILVSTLQVIFLRKDIIKTTDKIDFDNEIQRDEFINNIVDRIFFDIQ